VASIEFVDVVDEHNSVVDVAAREMVRRRNLLHRTIAVVCRNGTGQILTHRRSRTKDVYASFYDMLVGGVVMAGESYDEAASREVAEEFGIRAEPDFLFLHLYNGPLKRCWIAAYEVEWGGPIRPQRSEVASWAWISEHELLQTLTEWDVMPDHLEVFQKYRSIQAPG